MEEVVIFETGITMIRREKRLLNAGTLSSRKNYFTRIVFVVVLVELPLLTDVRTRTLPLLVVRALEFMRILTVRAMLTPPFIIL